MKVTISLAVLALLGEVSAIQLERQHNQHLAQQRWAPDYQGKYAQMSRRSQQNHLQLNDHKNDTDDLVANENFVQFDHENDTEDIPENLDPFSLVQTTNKTQKSPQEWDQMYQEEEDEKSFEFLQIKYDHENDTEDIPNGLDPIALSQTPFKSQLSPEEEKQQIELNAIVNESGEDLVQLSFSQDVDLDTDEVFLQYSFNPHEADTDDIAESENPNMYDPHHSKMWNDTVNKKALELEQSIQIEENMEKSKQKAKDEAERKASIIKFNEEQEKKRFADKKDGKNSLVQKAKKNSYKTIDLEEVYGSMV